MDALPGVDYPWDHPGGAALKAAGKVFACRYLSHDPTKNITRAEADDLAAHGVWAVLVWETTANRAGAGRAAGVADAKTAEAQAAAAGMPSGRPIYFAVDYDAVPSTVDAYFQGVASVISVARTGVYGGYRVVKHLRDAGLVSWIWQTTAWSGGLWDPRTNLRQPLGTLHINGADCDIDTAHTPDYGQWMPGITPTPPQEIDMTPAEHQMLVDLTAAVKALTAALVPFKGWDYANTDERKADPHSPDAWGKLGATLANSKATLAAVKAGSAPTLTDAQVAALAGQVVPVLVPQLVTALGHALDGTKP